MKENNDVKSANFHRLRPVIDANGFRDAFNRSSKAVFSQTVGDTPMPELRAPRRGVGEDGDVSENAVVITTASGTVRPERPDPGDPRYRAMRSTLRAGINVWITKILAYGKSDGQDVLIIADDYQRAVHGISRPLAR